MLNKIASSILSRFRRWAEGTHTLLDINCTGMDASTQEALEIPFRIEVLCTANAGRTSQVNEEVEKKVELMKIAEAREEAIRLADAGEKDLVIQTLSKKLEDLENGSVLYDLNLIGEVEELKSNIGSMPSYNPTVRKKMQYSNY